MVQGLISLDQEGQPNASKAGEHEVLLGIALSVMLPVQNCSYWLGYPAMLNPHHPPAHLTLLLSRNLTWNERQFHPSLVSPATSIAESAVHNSALFKTPLLSVSCLDMYAAETTEFTKALLKIFINPLFLGNVQLEDLLSPSPDQDQPSLRDC